MDLDFETKLLALPSLRSFAKTIVKNKALKSEEVQQALSTFFSNYQERFDAINKITCKDLNNGQKLSIIKHDLTAQSREMFDEYIRDLDIMNMNKFVDDELDIMTAAIPADLTDCVRQKAITWHHNFLVTWDKFNTDDSMKSIISADLSVAYSNTKLRDLENAIELAGTTLTMDAWKVELLISMARVIINNNYAQTSNGICYSSNGKICFNTQRHTQQSYLH